MLVAPAQEAEPLEIAVTAAAVAAVVNSAAAAIAAIAETPEELGSGGDDAGAPSAPAPQLTANAVERGTELLSSMADVSVDVGLAEGTASALLGAAGSMIGAVEALLSADDGGAGAVFFGHERSSFTPG